MVCNLAKTSTLGKKFILHGEGSKGVHLRYDWSGRNSTDVAGMRTFMNLAVFFISCVLTMFSLLWALLLIKECYCVQLISALHVHAQSLQSRCSLCDPWIIAHQASLPMGFSRREYWSGLPCPPPGDLLNQAMDFTLPASPSLQGAGFTVEPLGKHLSIAKYTRKYLYVIGLERGFPGGPAVKEFFLLSGRPGFDPWIGKIPWRRERLPTLVFWSGEAHGLYI